MHVKKNKNRNKKNKNYDINLERVIKLQRWIKCNYLKRMIKVWLKSKEFNEWFYSPNGIEGKQHKKDMEIYSLVDTADEAYNLIKELSKGKHLFD